MEFLLAVAIGAIVAVAFYLIFHRSIMRIVLGLFLLSHAANLAIFVVGGLRKNAIPILGDAPAEIVADPLVQAIVLTAIVISFGIAAFLLVLVSQTHREMGTDDIDDLNRLRG